MPTARPTRKPPPGETKTASTRKPGRPFKTARTKPERHAALSDADGKVTENTPITVPPPSIPFRSFKIALSALKERGAMPDQLDRSIWTNKLFGTNLRDTIEACRFFGLIDQRSEPTKEFEPLINALDTEAWSSELRRLLERSYQPLLACSISALTAGGLLRTFRTIYRTPGETTRKCCNFFVHAAREAALDIGPFLLTNSRSKWVDGRRMDRWDTTAQNDTAERAADGSNSDALRSLIRKFPTYDSAWPEDVKRLWFEGFNDLIRRLGD